MSVTLNPTVPETFHAATDTLADHVLATALPWESVSVMGPGPVTRNRKEGPSTS
ncbi:hypothetical protein ACFWA9_04325 [Kitasatospora sp. NPDC059973]|uniref:hypothetical protein n=1 Tax=Kitasatospora sp. NPDC059973 TaxID=3347020 RepID=UPI0036798F1B